MAMAADEVKPKDEVRWLPLESNPKILNKFSRAVGLPDDYSWFDVYSFDEEVLEFMPKSCKAAILLFPVEKFDIRNEEIPKDQKISKELFYTRQYIRNACGTIASIHAVANCGVNLNEDSALKTFVEEAQSGSKSPEQIGEDLKTCEALASASRESAESKDAQTETPDIMVKLGDHFAAFIRLEGDIYELDGRKKGPINHGPATSGDNDDSKFLYDVVKIVKEKFIPVDPTSVRFNLMALAKSSDVFD